MHCRPPPRRRRGRRSLDPDTHFRECHARTRHATWQNGGFQSLTTRHATWQNGSLQSLTTRHATWQNGGLQSLTTRLLDLLGRRGFQLPRGAMAEAGMQAPLLVKSDLSGNERASPHTLSTLDHPEDSWPSRDRLSDEAVRLLRLTWPVFGMNLCQVLIPVISMAFVGHLGSVELASAAIATTIFNVIGNSVLMSLAGGLQTLFGQAYGAGQYLQMGDLLQRGILILNLIAIPVAVLLMRLESVMLLIGQDPDLAAYGQTYARHLILGLFATAWLTPMELYLQTQGLVTPTMVASIAVIILHLPLTWVVTHKLGLGFTGPAICTSLSTSLLVVVLVGYAACSGVYKRTWRGVTWAACFTKWGQFFGMALPSFLMSCLEWWCFELTVVFAGLLPNPAIQVASLTITQNIRYLSIMFPLALSLATTIRVSNELGGGNPTAAKLAATAGCVLAAIAGAFIALLLFSLRNWLPTLFTDGKSDSIALRHLASALIPLLAVSQITEYVQWTSGGVLRGAGRQVLGAAVNVVAFYVLATPVMICLAMYYQFGVRGIWIGLMLGSTTQMVGMMAFTLRLDWKVESQLARDRFEEKTNRDHDYEDDITLIKSARNA